MTLYLFGFNYKMTPVHFNIKLGIRQKVSNTVLMRYCIIGLGILFVFSTFRIQAQGIEYLVDASNKVQKQFIKADKKFNSGDKSAAFKIWNKIEKKHPYIIDVYIKKGAAYYKYNQLEEAKNNFEYALSLDSIYEPKLYSTLGIIHKERREYNESIFYFTKYLGLCTQSNLCEKIEKLKRQAEFVMRLSNEAIVDSITKLPGEINTNDPEYLASMTADGETLVFTRRINGQEDLFISYKKDDGYSQGESLDIINTEENEGGHTISADGHTIIYTSCDLHKTIGSCDLFVSYLIKGEWTKPKSLGNIVNSISWDAQPSLSADGQKLFFSSTRKEGYGGKDIWVSLKGKKGNWHKPVNLGPVINTSKNEASPFLHQDLRTLYFRSDGHLGIGGYDLFMIRFYANYSKIDSVKNLGYPINTPYDEGALSISNDGTTAFFASDRIDSLSTSIDIFTFPLDESIRPLPSSFFRIQVLEAQTSIAIEGVRISLKDESNQWEFADGYTDEKGTYSNSLPGNERFGMTMVKDGYVFHSENVDFSNSTSLNPYLKTIYLQKMPVAKQEAKPVILKNVFFETNTYVLLDKSDNEIQNLIKILNDNPLLKIRILGHTDNVGSVEKNMNLSKKRANSVKNALVENGILESRVSYFGMGETEPIDTNETEEGRQNNRRTAFVLFSE